MGHTFKREPSGGRNFLKGDDRKVTPTAESPRVVIYPQRYGIRGVGVHRCVSTRYSRIIY